ncbi:MAG: EAL domain-containing protein [Planctomycetaceae bacterium]|nr:EAL domain-containing protein [Planctomycetaceae bacterium]
MSAKPCARCETLPDALPDAGRLVVWLPLAHTGTKLAAALAEQGFASSWVGAEDRLDIEFAAGQLGSLSRAVEAGLSGVELRAARALCLSPDREPTVRDVHRVMPVTQLLGLAQSQWIVNLLAEDRLTSHFQPIVHAEDPSRIFAHEALLRGRRPDGTLVAPGLLFDAATQCDLLFQLDVKARMSALRQAAANQITSHLFVNFSPAAIYDPAFCLQRTVATAREVGIESERVVFEVIESSHCADVEHVRRILEHYRGHGFRVALDDVGAGYSGLNLMHQLRPDFIKLDTELIRGVDREPYKAAIAHKVLQLARELGVETVCEGIETLGELDWVQSHGANYVQGFLIARPSATAFVALPAVPTAAPASALPSTAWSPLGSSPGPLFGRAAPERRQAIDTRPPTDAGLGP